jgi:hypothetical protein
MPGTSPGMTGLPTIKIPIRARMGQRPRPQGALPIRVQPAYIELAAFKSGYGDKRSSE